MATPDALYGTIVTARVASSDGHVYRADVDLHGYSGPASTLSMRGLTIRWGADGGAVTGAAPLAPVAVSKAVLTLAVPRPGQLAWIGSQADGAVRLRVVRETGTGAVADGGPGLCWLGYAQPESVDDGPYAADTSVSITFQDGLGLLDGRPFAGDGAYRPGLDVYNDGEEGWQARSPLAGVLGQLSALGGDAAAASAGTGGWLGLTTAVDWRPWQVDEMPATDDPLARLLVRESVWLDADGASVTALAALRAICARFNARLYQSAGRWHLTQRGLLSRTEGVDVPTFLYDAGVPTPTTEGESATATLLRETRTTLHGGGTEGPRRPFALPVRMAESLTQVRGDLDSVVVNGSFERPGATDAEAQGWTSVQGERVPADDWYETLTASDRYVMELTTSAAGGTRGTATQVGMAFVPASPQWRFDITWTQFLDGDAVYDLAGILDFLDKSAFAAWGGLAVTVGDHSAVLALVTTIGEIFPGDTSQVRVEALGADYAGASTGTLAIAAGTAVDLWEPVTPSLVPRATIVLSQPAFVGDLRLVGAVTLADGETSPITDGLSGHFYRWTTDAANPMTGAFASNPLARSAVRRMVLPGTDLAGVAVSGLTTVVAYGTATQAATASASIAAIDDVTIALMSDGGRPSASGVRARLPGGVPGLEVASATHPFGDGPTSGAEGSMDVRQADTTHEHVNQGVDTGWTWGAFGDGDPTTGVTIDELATRDALAQLAHGERVRTTWLQRPGQPTLSPEHVVRHWPLVALALPAIAGTETVYTYVPPRVGGTLVVGAQTAAGVLRASAETHAVLSVTPGAGMYAVELSAPLASSHAAGSRCAYDRLFWWDAFAWDVPSGGVTIDGTDLELDAREPSTELILAT